MRVFFVRGPRSPAAGRKIDLYTCIQKFCSAPGISILHKLIPKYLCNLPSCKYSKSVVYYNCPKGKRKNKGDQKMDFYSMEKFEIMGDALEELIDWFNYEADMASNPYEI